MHKNGRGDSFQARQMYKYENYSSFVDRAFIKKKKTLGSNDYN